MKLKDDEYLTRSGRVLVNSDIHLESSGFSQKSNSNNGDAKDEDYEDDDDSKSGADSSAARGAAEGAGTAGSSEIPAAAKTSFRGMDWEDEKEDEQLFCSKFIIEPKLLRICLLLGMLSGMVTGWALGKNFGYDYFFYFQYACPGEDDFRYETYPNCEPMPFEKQDRLNLIATVNECVTEVIAAALVSPIISDRWGRKRTFIVGAAFNLVGALGQACSRNLSTFYTFLAFTTFSLGLLVSVGPIYLSEISPIHRRGRYTVLWYIGATVGFVLASVVNVLLREVSPYGWRLTYVGDIVISALILALALWPRVPESHHFYILQRQYDNALRVLRSIRLEEVDEGNKDPEEPQDQQQKALDDAIVRWEFQGLIQERYETIGKSTPHTFRNKYRNLLLGGRPPSVPAPSSKKKKKKHKYSPRMPQRLLYGCLLQFMSQFSGFQDVTFDLTMLVSSVYGSDKTENWNIAIYCFSCIAAVFCYLSIERIGRPMILFSGGLVIFILLLMSYFVDKAIAQSGGYPAQADAFYYLMLFVFFEMGFSFSWGPVTYVYCAEVFDIGTRAAGVGLTSSVEAISSTMIRMYFITYATVLPEFYQHMTFLSVAAISFLFVYYLLPETSNKTSNEIGKAYQKHRPAILRLDWGPN